jgi:hypothetical protein
MGMVIRKGRSDGNKKVVNIKLDISGKRRQASL